MFSRNADPACLAHRQTYLGQLSPLADVELPLSIFPYSFHKVFRRCPCAGPARHCLPEIVCGFRKSKHGVKVEVRLGHICGSGTNSASHTSVG